MDRLSITTSFQWIQNSQIHRSIKVIEETVLIHCPNWILESFRHYQTFIQQNEKNISAIAHQLEKNLDQQQTCPICLNLIDKKETCFFYPCLDAFCLPCLLATSKKDLGYTSCQESSQAYFRVRRDSENSLETIFFADDAEKYELYNEDEDFDLPIHFRILQRKFQHIEGWILRKTFFKKKLTLQSLHDRFLSTPE